MNKLNPFRSKFKDGTVFVWLLSTLTGQKRKARIMSNQENDIIFDTMDGSPLYLVQGILYERMTILVPYEYKNKSVLNTLMNKIRKAGVVVNYQNND